MHYRLILGVALLPLTTAVTGCGRRAEAAQQTAAETAAPVIVRPVAKTARHRAIVASGTIEARASADLAFQVPGKVIAIAVDEGQRVREGQLLARLDATEYGLAYDQATLTHERSADEAQRARVLQSVDGIAANDLAKLTSAEKLSVVSAALAEKHLADTRLAAPLSGTVARRAIDVGEMVASGTPAFTIVDLDVVHVRVAVPEGDVGAISSGQPATITVPSLGNVTFDGRVRLVGVAADRTTRTYAVEIAVPNANHRLRAGMIAEATIRTPEQVARLSVPAAAVVRDAQGATRLFVYAESDQRVHARKIEVVGMNESEIDVAGGIAEGELVVIGGQHRLREGMRAKPTTDLIVVTGAPASTSSTDLQQTRDAARGSAQ